MREGEIEERGQKRVENVDMYKNLDVSSVLLAIGVEHTHWRPSCHSHCDYDCTCTWCFNRPAFYIQKPFNVAYPF